MTTVHLQQDLFVECFGGDEQLVAEAVCEEVSIAAFWRL